jgi:hypothetical protein
VQISVEVMKQFVITRIIPPLAGALATWVLTNIHFLSIFHFQQDETAKAISELAVFGVTTAFAWLSAHFSLKGHYLPGKTGADQGGAPERAVAQVGPQTH